jgi:DNA-binding MarR family transcriptional regulator
MATRDRLDFLSDSWRATRPDIDITPWQVWGRTTRIHELFLGYVTRSLRGHALTFTEFQTLGALVLAGPPYAANPNQIQRFNLLTSGGLANLLGRMEREGLIERRPDTQDKRGVIVQLTPLGLQHFNDALVEENRVEHELLAGLSGEERAILSMLLRKLLLSIDPEHLAEPADAPARPRAAVAGAGRAPVPTGAPPAAAARAAPGAVAARARSTARAVRARKGPSRGAR